MMTRAVHEAQNTVSGAYQAPAGSGSDDPDRSLFRGILAARTRGAGPVGPGSGSSRGRGLDGPVPLFSLRRCLAEGGRKRNVGTIRVSGKREP